MPASTVQRPQRPARKINREKVLALKAKGVAVNDIARNQGVDRRTIFRYLASTDQERQEVAAFQRGRADVFDTLAFKSLNVQAAILESLWDDGVLTPLTPHQKTGLLAVLSAQHGTLYDKMRLEKGQSTSNVSLVHRLMAQAFERAGRDTTESSPPERSTPHESSSSDGSRTEGS